VNGLHEILEQQDGEQGRSAFRRAATARRSATAYRPRLVRHGLGCTDVDDYACAEPTPDHDL
jgi:hypothetical protein